MARLNRRDAVGALLRDRRDLLAVAGLGSPVYDVFAAGDHALNFYDWGAMGSAAMVGLGLALARPGQPVVVFTGDGEMLMGLGAFATMAQHRPPNLSVVVLDNEQYAETGGQRTATAFGVDLADVARGCGIADARTLDTMDQVRDLRADLHARTRTLVRVLKIEPGDVPRSVPLKDGVAIKVRFAEALGRSGAP